MNQWWTKHDENGVEIWKEWRFFSLYGDGFKYASVFWQWFLCVVYVVWCYGFEAQEGGAYLVLWLWLLFLGFVSSCVVGTVTFLGVNGDDWNEWKWSKDLSNAHDYFLTKLKRILLGVTCACFKNFKKCTSRIAKALCPLCYLCSNVYEINKDLNASAT